MACIEKIYYRVERFNAIIYAIARESQEKIKITDLNGAIDFYSKLENIPKADARLALVSELRNKPKEYTSVPLMLTWELTNKCNCFCKHCGNNAGEPLSNELCREEIQEIIGQIKQMNILKLTLTGGEPLLSPYLEEICNSLNSYVPRLGLSTNGLLVNKAQARKIKDIGIKVVKLSLDGTKEFHDKFRGVNGLYDKNLRAIDYFWEQNIEVRVQSTITRENSHLLKELSESLKGKVNQITFVPLAKIGRAREKDMLSAQEYKSFIESMIEYANNLDTKTILHIRPVFSYCSFDSAWSNTKILNMKYKCEALRTNMEITAAGDVIPCSFYQKKIGNIRENSLIEIWLSKEAEKVRETFSPRTFEGKCKTCPQLNDCSGGCLANASIENNVLTRGDRYCWVEND